MHAFEDAAIEAPAAGLGAEFDVVIVDDRATNRAIFSRLAASVGPGVRVRAFDDPVEALAWPGAARADLVVTDYRMPGMDGAEFVARLRALPGGKEVPIVVVTAYADRRLRLRALEAGATDFLHSPVDPDEFRTRARNLLTMSHQRRLLHGRAADLAAELEESEASCRRIVRESRERLARVIDTVPAMIGAVDRGGHCVFANAHRAAAHRAVLSPSAPGEDGEAPPLLFGRAHRRRSRALDGRVFETGQALPPHEEEVRDAAGERRVLLTIKAPLHDGDGAVTSVLTTSLDITERKRAEERLAHLARHDGLTGLLNRAAFRERLERELAKVTRGDRGFALHYVDLDRFKRVNDGFGHHAGDALLRASADRLARAVGEDGVIARLGGDEFGVLQFAPADEARAAALAERVLLALAAPVTVEGASVHTGASIGVTRCPRDGRAADALLRNADSAMYRAKLAGRGQHRFFNDGGEGEGDPVDELRRDLARKRFALHYQPQFAAATGALVGAEALLRWRRQGWGLLVPGAFLPAAERGGLALPLGEWVLHEACSHAARWQRAGAAPVGVSVNVSPAQARDAGLAWTVRGALDASGLPPDRLTLELTEDSLTYSAASLPAALAELRALGVRVCLDNFGAGRSPPASLRHAPVDRVKVDRSLVQGDDAAAFKAAVALGRLLAAEVLACGVETAQHLARARAAGCDVLQGFHLGRPEAIQEFAARATAAG